MTATRYFFAIDPPSACEPPLHPGCVICRMVGSNGRAVADAARRGVGLTLSERGRIAVRIIPCLSLSLLLTLAPSTPAEPPPQTVAEKSDYKATSRHADVVAFCEAL